MTAAQPCAGGIVFDTQRRLLVVRRAQAPGAGQWSIPGGRCLDGEPAEAACVREVREETGLTVRVRRLAGAVERAGPGGVRYAITDFECDLVGGNLCAGDDAADARWVGLADLTQLDTVPGLLEALGEWDLLPD